jgi:Ca2+-binding RTX toxin-like protein
MAKGLKLKDAGQASSDQLETTTTKAQVKLANGGGGESLDLGENSKEIDINDVISGVPKFQEQLDQLTAEKTAQDQEVTLDDISDLLSKEGLEPELDSLKQFFKSQKFENTKDFMEKVQQVKNQAEDSEQRESRGKGRRSNERQDGDDSAESTQNNSAQDNTAEAQGNQQNSNQNNQNQQRSLSAEAEESSKVSVEETQSRRQEIREEIKEQIEEIANSDESIVGQRAKFERFRDNRQQEEVEETEVLQTDSEAEPIPEPDPYDAPELKEATVSGGEGNEKLVGGSENDVINGGEGNDKLYGGEGDDTFQVVGENQGSDYFHGGEGQDVIEAVDGADVNIQGHFTSKNSIEKISGTGDSEINGDSRNNVLDFSKTEVEGVSKIDGGDGHDRVYGSQGDDNLAGGSGNDQLRGNEGEDNLDGGSGNDRLYGGESNDVLSGGEGNDALYGGAGDDTLIADGQGKDHFDGGKGNDTIQVAKGEDLVIDRSLNTRNSIEKIEGDGKTDILGDDSNNHIDLSKTELEGIDKIDGGAGRDTIKGSQAGDDVSGGAGNDRLYGEDGNDVLSGGEGNDALYGGDGNDTLIADGQGKDYYHGGKGNDTVEVADGQDLVIDTHLTTKNSIENIKGDGSTDILGDESNNSIDLSKTNLDGIDKIDGGAGNDTVKGSQASDDISGGSGNDRLYGESGQDNLQGGDGNDALYGGADNDTLSGGAGNDKLYGGSGDDTLIADGQGKDYFHGGEGNDTIQVVDGQDLVVDSHLTTKNSIENIKGDGNTDIVGDESNNSIDLSKTNLDGIDKIDGGAGRDTIKGSQSDDNISGGEGNDALYGNTGDDVLSGGAGNDRMYGGEGSDTFLADGGFDYYHGGEGVDTIKATAGNDIGVDSHLRHHEKIEKIEGNGDTDIVGDSGNNAIDLSQMEVSGIDRIDGGAGNDYIKGSQGSDNIYGGEGNDRLYGAGGNDNLYADGNGYDDYHGGEGHDTIHVSDGENLQVNNHLRTRESIEEIKGDGDTEILGDNSNNHFDFSQTELDGISKIDGGAGNDYIKGSQAADEIHGGEGNDRLYGAGGDDNLYADGNGFDDYHGGEGTDTIHVADGENLQINNHLRTHESIEEIKGDGNADIVGDNSNNSFDFSNTELDGIDQIDGGAGNDSIKGSDGDDNILGGDGNDRLYTSGGNDTFDGGDGFDSLNFSGRAGEYDFYSNGNTLIVQDQVDGRDGQVIIEDIEQLNFRGSRMTFESAFEGAEDVSAQPEVFSMGMEAEDQGSWDQMVEGEGQEATGSGGSWEELVENSDDNSGQDDVQESYDDNSMDQQNEVIDGSEDIAA